MATNSSRLCFKSAVGCANFLQTQVHAVVAGALLFFQALKAAGLIGNPLLQLVSSSMCAQLPAPLKLLFSFPVVQCFAGWKSGSLLCPPSSYNWQLSCSNLRDICSISATGSFVLFFGRSATAPGPRSGFWIAGKFVVLVPGQQFLELGAHSRRQLDHFNFSILQFPHILEALHA